MIVKILATDGKGFFDEREYDKPDPAPGEIEVRAAMTGVCRSDVSMMRGEFGPLPLSMQGHEGLGVVTRTGEGVTDVREGDFVATRGEPAYADFYNAAARTYVKVPALDPRFILEPVACAVHLVRQNMMAVVERAHRKGSRLAIVGTGFLASMCWQFLKASESSFKFDRIEVVGRHNRELWPVAPVPELTGAYDAIIDLKSDLRVLAGDHFANNALYVMAAEKKLAGWQDDDVLLGGFEQAMERLLWKAVSIECPSPRHPRFFESMWAAGLLVAQERIDPSPYWTRGYRRADEWRTAFADADERPEGYSRGYIYWDWN